jgi:hypothetical protein
MHLVSLAGNIALEISVWSVTLPFVYSAQKSTMMKAMESSPAKTATDNI